MLPLLLLAFIVVPIVELAVIIAIGGRIGLPLTVALLLLDSVLGAVLVRSEGRRAWRAFRSALQAGRWPGDEVVQGALILVGGALLVTPGFVTDAVGLLALLPPTRTLASRYLRRRLTPVPLRRDAGWAAGPGGQAEVGREGRRAAPRGRRRSRTGARQGQVIDVEVVSVERHDDPGESRTGDQSARPRRDGSSQARDKRA
ncbi:MAG: FxsA family protein [Actinomycetota bacterium]|nr:FxsA family protein [Actinomycetota bacterium]